MQLPPPICDVAGTIKMPPSLRPAQLIHINRAPYVCSSCRHQVLRQRIWQLQLIRSASSGVPFTERLRRKIWGTDNPPGLEDPYGGPSYFEKRRQQAREGREGPEPATAPPEPHVLEPESAPTRPYEHAQNKKLPSRSVPENDPEKEDPDYVPAETWDGLERVGSSGHWSEKPPSPKEMFRP
jgi:protein kinase C substrate 80K-H